MKKTTTVTRTTMMDDLQTLLDKFSHDADMLTWAVRAFYILSAYAIIVVRFIPDLKHRFLDYGARSAGSKRHEVKDSALPRWVRIQFDPVLDWLADVTVPHSWFTHFYFCSTVCSACCLFMNRRFFHPSEVYPSFDWLSNWQTRSMLALLLLQVQGLRRLYECLVIARPSRSRMWVGHYAIGLAFYLVTNAAVWIEPALQPHNSNRLNGKGASAAMNAFNLTRIVGCVFIFFQSSYQQYHVHKYLASLKEYRVPDHPIFRKTNLICPHYGFEVNIYLALAILTARGTRIFNLTMLCAAVFVAVNLGITADLTKNWQMEKFPKQRAEIASRRRMLWSIW